MMDDAAIDFPSQMDNLLSVTPTRKPPVARNTDGVERVATSVIVTVAVTIVI